MRPAGLGQGEARGGVKYSDAPAYVGRRRDASLGSFAQRVRAMLRADVPEEDVLAIGAVIGGQEWGWDEWNKVGMALWAASDGEDHGLETFLTISSKSRKYNEEEATRRWEHYATSPPSDLGYGTLVLLARQYDPAFEPPSRARLMTRPWLSSSNSHSVSGMGWQPAGAQGASVTSVTGSGINGFAGVWQQPIVFPDLDTRGRPRGTCVNTRVALQVLGIPCVYDTFHDRMTIGDRTVHDWAGDLTDNAVHMLRVLIYERFRFDPSVQTAFEAAVQEALLHQVNPVQAYLDSLTWDRHGRLAGWFTTYLGSEPSRLGAAMGVLVLVAAVRRARRPGCKFDQIVVLEGPEGYGKSSAIELLAGSQNFNDQPLLNLSDRAQQEELHGVWLYEIADLAGHRRAEIEKVKAFASRTVDRARPAYGRTRVDRPRTCVLIATTNDERYLKSLSGNRRFWPVRTGRINLAALARDRDQLWAEAAAIEATGMSLTLPETLWGDAAAVQDERLEADPFFDALADVQGKPTADGETRVTSMELFMRLGLELGQVTDVAAKRIAYCMRKLGWDGPKKLREGEKTPRGYTRKT